MVICERILGFHLFSAENASHLEYVSKIFILGIQFLLTDGLRSLKEGLSFIISPLVKIVIRRYQQRTGTVRRIGNTICTNIRLQIFRVSDSPASIRGILSFCCNTAAMPMKYAMHSLTKTVWHKTRWSGTSATPHGFPIKKTHISLSTKRRSKPKHRMKHPLCLGLRRPFSSVSAPPSTVSLRHTLSPVYAETRISRTAYEQGMDGQAPKPSLARPGPA